MNDDFIIQRSEDWKEARRGKFTASEIHKLMGIKGLGKTGESYIYEKVAESLGCPIPHITTYAMQYGTEMEDGAKRYYSRLYNVSISEQPFIVPDWCEDCGASPDGIVLEWDDNNNPITDKPRRGIEIKCPINPAIHVANLMIKDQQELKSVRTEYYWQVMMCMAVTGLRKWDFVSFFPVIEEGLALFSLAVYADNAEIELLKSRIFEAVEMKNQILKSIRS